MFSNSKRLISLDPISIFALNAGVLLNAKRPLSLESITVKGRLISEAAGSLLLNTISEVIVRSVAAAPVITIKEPRAVSPGCKVPLAFLVSNVIRSVIKGVNSYSKGNAPGLETLKRTMPTGSLASTSIATLIASSIVMSKIGFGKSTIVKLTGTDRDGVLVALLVIIRSAVCVPSGSASALIVYAISSALFLKIMPSGLSIEIKGALAFATVTV